MTPKQLKSSLRSIAECLLRDVDSVDANPIQLLDRTEQQLELIRLEMPRHFERPGLEIVHLSSSLVNETDRTHNIHNTL